MCDIKIFSINLDLKKMKIEQTMKIDNEYISTIIELTNDNLLSSCIHRKIAIFKKNEKGEYYKLNNINRKKYGFDSIFQLMKIHFLVQHAWLMKLVYIIVKLEKIF